MATKTGKITARDSLTMYVTLESWQSACQMIKQEGNRLESYLQWYPFSQLSESSWKVLTSESYFEKYIQDASFILCSSMRYVTKGYIQKQGSSLRDAYLTSPVLFLYLLAYGIEYSKQFVQPRSEGLSLYAGNLDECQMNYQRSWHAYCGALKYNSSSFEYCLRTDVSNFFGTINVDSLISKMQKYSFENYSATEGFFLKALLLYCGNGKYPTIQNHPTLSFLATDVYLAEVDQLFQERLRKMASVKSFELVRYVDDMCLFFNVEDGANLLSVKQAITNCYADILRAEGLVLNQNKLELQRAEEILKTMASVSCVDFTGAVVDGNVAVPNDAVSNYFQMLAEAVKQTSYSHNKLLEAIDACFAIDEPPTPPMTVFRHCLYRQQELFKTPEAIAAMRNALQGGTALFSYNTTDLIQCFLNSEDEYLVKQLLNGLFKSSRNATWSSLDSLAAVTYLIHRGMWHPDLRKHLEIEEPGLSFFCETFCRADFVRIPPSDAENKTIAILSGDEPSKTQFAHYLRHHQTKNLLESASYYRAFFDRFSSFVWSRVQKKKHTWLYKERDLKEVYCSVAGSEEKIREMERLRQSNPLVHASSEILTNPAFESDLIFVVNSINEIITEYLNTIRIEAIS